MFHFFQRRCVHDENGNFSPHKGVDTVLSGKAAIDNPRKRPHDTTPGDSSKKACSELGSERRAVSAAFSRPTMTGLSGSNVHASSGVSTTPISKSARRASTGAIASKSPVIRISPTKMGKMKGSAAQTPDSAKKTPKRRAKEVEETDEMKSERLARQLAAEEWGLRRQIRRRAVDRSSF